MMPPLSRRTGYTPTDKLLSQQGYRLIAAVLILQNGADGRKGLGAVTTLIDDPGIFKQDGSMQQGFLFQCHHRDGQAAHPPRAERPP